MAVVTAALGVPIDSVGAASVDAAPFGTEQMPAALRRAGLVTGLGLPDRGDLPVRLVDPSRDRASGLTAWPSLDGATRTIRTAVRKLIEQGERPLLLGGCCAMVPAAVSALRDASGAAGVINVDGHLDLYDAATSPTGEAADVPIAALLGHGVPAWSDALSPMPVVEPDEVALVGFRDLGEAQAAGSVMPEALGINSVWDVADVRADPTRVGELAGSALGGTRFWVHLDLDVLSEEVMPATDYLMPGGLNYPQLSALLLPLVHDRGFSGLSVACLNPDKDPGGASARAVADLLVGVLSH
ncbi:MAG TPA: arginase family protein [Actinomycetes bacterium]|nr:arginase family protein [Actinomycetes bacterium]